MTNKGTSNGNGNGNDNDNGNGERGGKARRFTAVDSIGLA